MRVRDAMTPPVTCDAESTLASVTALMRERSSTAVVVMRDGRMAGIVTDHDIARRVVAMGPEAAALPVETAMSWPLVLIDAEAWLDDAVQLMEKNHVHHLAVANDESRLLGLIALSDIRAPLPRKGSPKMLREGVMGTTLICGERHRQTHRRSPSFSY
jgi:signal-transduction protein with cAMP-binding, CBS, and nucleotidyltransferase domain